MRFSVADVPVANQTAVGTFFSSKKLQKDSQSLAIYRRKIKKKWQGSLGGRGTPGAQKIAATFSPASEQRDTWCTQILKLFGFAAFAPWPAAVSAAEGSASTTEEAEVDVDEDDDEEEVDDGRVICIHLQC